MQRQGFWAVRIQGKVTVAPNKVDFFNNVFLNRISNQSYPMIAAIFCKVSTDIVNCLQLYFLEGELSWSYPCMIKGHITPKN